ncbi:hypothetical protein EYF80_006631 [Liparis tanakae]|uniref:Uncharacterized protein n=1 Tax=Liparis tanakae TaxID=230148 RepID=A0A4Z2IZP0_9TELE|nr:hypothetical protein EYF80_006631 [Liparis tanakae]
MSPVELHEFSQQMFSGRNDSLDSQEAAIGPLPGMKWFVSVREDPGRPSLSAPWGPFFAFGADGCFSIGPFCFLAWSLGRRSRSLPALLQLPSQGHQLHIGLLLSLLGSGQLPLHVFVRRSERGQLFFCLGSQAVCHRHRHLESIYGTSGEHYGCGQAEKDRSVWERRDEDEGRGAEERLS